MFHLRGQQPAIKVGDIIGFSGCGLPGIAINLLTYGIPFWNISHVGIIGEYRGGLVLFESTTLSKTPCVIQQKLVKGTQAAHLEDRLGECPVWHFPLYRPLFDHEATRLNAFLLSYIGADYDYIGAIRAGGIGWSWLESLLHEEDLSYIFCSELCAAAHNCIGLLQTSNVSRWNPNRLIRHERRRHTLRKPWRLS